MKLSYPLAALSLGFAMMTGCANSSFLPKMNLASNSQADDTIDRQLSMARLGERHGQPDTATKIYEDVLTRDPANAVALHRLGVMAAENQQYDIALSHFQSALEYDPTNAELLSDIGYIYFLMDDLDSAESHLMAAIQSNPNFQGAHNNLGLVLGQKGRWNESLKHFRMAVDDAEAYANLAFIQCQVGELELAESSFHRALDLDPDLQPAAEGLVQLNERVNIFERQMLAQNNAAAQQGQAIAQANVSVQPSRSTVTQSPVVQTPVAQSRSVVRSAAQSTQPTASTQRAASNVASPPAQSSFNEGGVVVVSASEYEASRNVQNAAYESTNSAESNVTTPVTNEPQTQSTPVTSEDEPSDEAPISYPTTTVSVSPQRASSPSRQDSQQSSTATDSSPSYFGDGSQSGNATSTVRQQSEMPTVEPPPLRIEPTESNDDRPVRSGTFESVSG